MAEPKEVETLDWKPVVGGCGQEYSENRAKQPGRGDYWVPSGLAVGRPQPGQKKSLIRQKWEIPRSPMSQFLPWLFSVPTAAEDLPEVRHYEKRILTSFTGEGFAPVPGGWPWPAPSSPIVWWKAPGLCSQTELDLNLDSTVRAFAGYAVLKSSFSSLSLGIPHL